MVNGAVLRSPTATQPRFLLSPLVILCLCPLLSLADVIKLNECLGFSAQKEARGKSLLRPTATKPFPRPRPRLLVYVCSTVRTLKEALPVEDARLHGVPIDVRQTMGGQLKNKEKVTQFGHVIISLESKKCIQSSSYVMT